VIRTKTEYRNAEQTLVGLRAGVEAQRAEFEQMGLAPAEVERALQPMLGFVGQVAAELAQYERWREGQIAPVADLGHIGSLLIALRIARGWSQRELAARLGVSEAQVSRDERNGYHAITGERAQRILDALEARVTVEVQESLSRGQEHEPAGVR
jgi:DNA-binding Xre family transcriptional regulator